MTRRRHWRGDLLIATSGSGEIGHIDYVVDRAKAAGAEIAVVTADPAGRTARMGGWCSAFRPQPSRQGRCSGLGPAARNLFEQALLILFDQIVVALAAEMPMTAQAMAARHRNVE